MKKFTDEYTELIRSICPEFENETHEYIEDVYNTEFGVFIDSTWKDESIKEGLIMTYPTKKLLEKINSIVKCKFRFIKKDKSSWHNLFCYDKSVIPDDFVLIEIDTTKLPDNVQFHADCDFESLAARWTTSAIPPSAITNVEDI